jgi:hypothetical protein
MNKHEEPVIRSRSEIAEHLTHLGTSKGGEAEKLVKAFKAVIASSGDLILGIIKAARSGKRSKIGQELQKLKKDSNFEAMRTLAQEMGFKTIGIVGGGEFSVIISLEGTVGGLLPTTSGPPYAYESVGVSLGASEGVEAVQGLLVSTAKPSKSGGTSVYASLGGDLGAGVAVQVFTSPHLRGKKTWGMVILVSEGEEIDLSVGAGYSWVQKIK